MTLKVFVQGKPVPQGSMKAFGYKKKNGKIGISMLHNKQDKLYEWREKIKQTLLEKYPELATHVMYNNKEPIFIEVSFCFIKPKTNKDLYPVSRRVGDLDKLLRGISDAATGVVYSDDSQIVKFHATKEYAGRC